VGLVGRGGFQLQLDFAGEAGAFVEAEHTERTGELVGCVDGFLPELGSQWRDRGPVQQGQAFEDLGPIALPQDGDHLFGGGLLGFFHVMGTRVIVNFSVVWRYFLIQELAVNRIWWTRYVLAAGCVAGVAVGAQAQAVDASVCDVINHPTKFDGKLVKVKGLVQVDFDSFVMRGDSCTGSLWLSYPTGTKAKSGPAAVVTLQLAANATGTPGTARPALTLEKSADFAMFDLYLSTRPKTNGMCLGCVKSDVQATLVGRVDGTDNAGLVRDKAGKIASLDGFGNLNAYSARMVITSVSEVTPKEIDYSKTPKVADDSQGGSGKDYMALTKKAEDAFPKGTDAPTQIQAAIDAYGAPGQDNGVTIGFGDTANVPDGEGTKSAKSSPDGLLLTVKLDGDKLKGDSLSRAVAHEGTEIAMIRDKVVPGYREIESKSWNTALLVSIGSRQKTLTLPGGIVVWSDSWPAADRSNNAGAALTSYLEDRDQSPR